MYFELRGRNTIGKKPRLKVIPKVAAKSQIFLI